LAVLIDEKIAHPAIEALFTVDEETGLTGAFNLGEGMLTGKYLINLDSEDEGEVFIGCAGGVDTIATLTYVDNPAPQDYAYYKVTISGLLGGHSGDDIDKGHANSNKWAARIAERAARLFEARLSWFDGGNLRNAIPRDCDVVLTVPAENVEALKEVVDEWRETFKGEYGFVEKALTLDIEDATLPAALVPEEIQDNLVNALCACHNGVMRFIPEVPSIVETSSNLAIVEIGGGKVMFKVLVRSSRDSMRDCCSEALESVFSMAGMKIELDGAYPAWQPNPESEIVALMKDVYKELFNADSKVQVIHAGLECGVIGAKYPKMDMVSFGPTMRSPHTPNERCFIPSVEKYWQFVLTTLERTPQK
jgi:dipeptidase D